jgi:excinuclease ABC subunit C
VGAPLFDRRFGSHFLKGVPEGPGVYYFRDAQGALLYVGKALNLRARLGKYRTASRRKQARKARAILRAAAAVDLRTCRDEQEALLLENQCIRDERPPFNVASSFSFLYPILAFSHDAGVLRVAYSTAPEAFAARGFHVCGAFRSRTATRAAFDALVELLALVGHREPRARLHACRGVRFSAVAGFRRIAPDTTRRLAEFLQGRSRDLLDELVAALLEKPDARRRASQVQEAIDALAEFYESEATRLRVARERVGRGDAFVPQHERDALFIQARFADGASPPHDSQPAENLSKIVRI